jgi:hypothetical protein
MAIGHSHIMNDPFEAGTIYFAPHSGLDASPLVVDEREVRAQRYDDGRLPPFPFHTVTADQFNPRIISCFSNMTATGASTPSAVTSINQVTPAPSPAQVWPQSAEEAWVN